MKQWKKDLIKQVELKMGLDTATKVKNGLKMAKKMGLTSENTTDLDLYFIWRSTKEGADFWHKIYEVTKGELK